MKVLLLTLAFALAVAHAEPICQAKSNGLQSNRLQRRAVAPEGFCGVFEGKTIHCAPTDCCSQFGFCGNTADHCGTGCQAAFGKKCAPPPGGGEVLPPDGFCGVFQGKTIKCASSTCCSQFGFCGDTAQHCGTGCQSAFGKCTPPVVLPARTVPLPANAPEAKIHETCTTPGMLALTLDDGHSIEYNQIFLTYLKKEHVVATFFINGINGNWDISKNPEFVKRTYDAGHQIAHHTNTHADLAKLNDAELVSELCNLDMGIAAALGGITPRYIRFPYLSYSSRALKIAAFYGYTVVGTNLDTQDWDVTVKPSQLEYALKTYRDAFAKSSVKTNSFISLQHEILGFTANTLMKKLLPELDNVLLDRQQKPYDTVTVGKCIDKGSKPGDWYRKNIWHRDLKKDPKFYCPSLV